MTSPAQDAIQEQDPVITKLEETKTLVMRYYERFRAAEMGIISKHTKWAMLDQFDRGEQWKNANIPPWVPKPMTNMIRYLRTMKRANLASAIPMSNISALNEKYKDIIDRLQKGYEHVWHWEKVPRTIRRCVDRALLLGTSIGYVYEDTSYVGGVYNGKGNPENQLFQGKLCVKQYSIYNFFPDPDAYRLYDCKWLETTELLPYNTIKNNASFQKYVKNNHPDGLAYFDTFKGDMLDRDDHADGTVLDRENKPNWNLSKIKGDEMLTLHAHWERYIGEDHRWHLDVTYYTKNNYFPLLRIEDVKPSVYPFAIYYDEEEDQDIWGMSLAMDVLENQKVINKAAQTASIIGTLHQNPQKVVSRASGINAQELARTGTMPGKVWTSNDDPTKSIHVVQPADIPKGLFEIEDRMKADIKEMSGINEAYTGQSVGSLTTSTGVNSLIERATVRDKDKMIQIDGFCEEISHLIMLFILHKWKDERPLAIPQPDGSVQHGTYIPVDEAMIDNLEWLVKCDTYAVAPMTQALKSQEADNLLSTQGQYNFSPAVLTPQEWIQLKNFSNKSEILARMQEDAKIIAQRAQQQPPKIVPNGEISFTMNSKDPNVISDTLEQLMKQAQVNQQVEAKLVANHINNGLNVAPGNNAAPAAGPQAQGPAGTMDQSSQIAMQRGQ